MKGKNKHLDDGLQEAAEPQKAKGQGALSRRTFLKGAGLATVATGALIAGCSPQTTAADASSPSSGSDGTSGSGAENPLVGRTTFTTYANPDEIGLVHDTSQEETVDVVVVGSGITGLSCSMIIAEQAPSAKILMIDKNSFPGGNTNFAEINEPGQGMAWADALAKGVQTALSSLNLTDPYLYAHSYYDTGRITGWLYQKQGVQLADDHFYYKDHMGYGTVQHLVTTMSSDSTYANIELRTSTQGIALLMDDDHSCSGIQVKMNNAYSNIHAKAVMLATGGMGTNTDLLSYYTGQDVVQKCTQIGAGQDGDGHLMVETTAHGKSKNVDPTPMWCLIKDDSLNSALSVASTMQSANIFINESGARFSNEDYAGASPFASVVAQDHLFNNQGKVFSIMGQGLFDYFEAGGSDRSGFYYYQTPASLQDDLSTIGNNKNAYQADSFAALAALIGVPSDAFVSSLQTYQSDAAAGTDDTVFGKPSKYMVGLGDGPYYAFEVSTALIQTNNGIRINTDCAVCDQFYTPIKGLYAGGIAVSGFNTAIYTMGTSQHVGLWSGTQAARSIVTIDLGGTVADNWFGDSEYSGPLPDMSNL
ncbi:MAG: FAD-binding protein, partial [Coriobacteriia bacterium]|nr:FAD-binding protein [Coriobacteriia bacterium]